MKSIEIKNRTLLYEVVCDEDDIEQTDFYEGTEEETYRKYVFFGPKLTRTVPKYLFTIYRSIYDENLTKGWWRRSLLVKLELLERKRQIENGELI